LLALALAISLAIALASPLLSEGFPGFELGSPPRPLELPEMDDYLPYVMWEDRLFDLIAQAALALLAASVGVATVRLWRRGGP